MVLMLLFYSYLYGIETYEDLDVNDKFLPSFTRTFMELKRKNRDSQMNCVKAFLFSC